MPSQINIYNRDCLEAMKEMPNKAFDLAIVDPPYGIKDRMQGSRPMGKMSKDITWNENIPSKKYFEELMRVSRHQIIWGANYYANYLTNQRDWIVWDKKQSENIGYSMHELAWTSFDKVPKIARFRTVMTDRFHPCQKPVDLYAWILRHYAPPQAKILDTHLGSGSIAIACYDMGFDLIGFEIDKDYYEAAVKRLENHKRQMTFI